MAAIIDPQKKQVSSMAVAIEAAALNEFYRNRVLLLANEIEQLREENERLRGAQIAMHAKDADKKVMKNGLSE